MEEVLEKQIMSFIFISRNLAVINPEKNIYLGVLLINVMSPGNGYMVIFDVESWLLLCRN